MDDNVFGVTPESEEPAAPAPAPAQEDQVREAPGAGETHTLDQGGSTPPPATTVEADEEVDAFVAGEGEEGIRLGNKTWKDWQAADHVFRTFAGRAAAEARRRRELEAEVARLRAETAQRPPAPAQVADEAPEPVRRLPDLINEDEIEAMIAKDGPGAAFKKLAEMMESRVDAVVEERTRDVRPIAVRNQALELATQVFDAAASMTDAEGNRLYPELDVNSPASDVVVEIWKNNLQDPEVREIAFTPAGVRLAVMQARAHLQANRPPAPSTAAATRQAAATLQSMGSGSRVPAPRPGPTVRPDAEEAVRQLISSRTHPIFGVTMER